MPQAVAAVVAVAKVVFAVVKASAILRAILQVAAGLLLSKLLAPKPGQPGGGSRRQGTTFSIRQPTPSRRIPYGVVRLGGIYMYAETAGTDQKDLWLVLAIGDGPIESIDKMYFDGDEIALETNTTDSNGRDIFEPVAGHELEGLVTVSKYLGVTGASQPADASLVAASASKWTTSHTLDDIAYCVVKLTFDAEKFPQGIPSISFLIKGRNDIFDPRTSTTGYTANNALCWNHYMTTAQTGLGADYATEIDEDALIAAANVADESVSTGAYYASEPRYTCNGFVDLADNPESIITDFLQAMSGWQSYIGGKFVVHAGAYEAPTFEINEDMLAGPVNVVNQLPKRERFNLVKGVYVSPENHFQPADFPAAENSTYETEDGGEIVADLDLVFTTSPNTAQRIAKIELEAARQQKRVSIVTNLRGLPAQAGETVMFTFSRYGWEQKVFLVESSTLVPLDGGAIGLALSLREWASSVYDWDWNTDQKTVAAAPTLTVGAPKVDDVVASPTGGDSPIADFPIGVTLTCATTDAIIRWSKSATPTSSSAGFEYDANDASTHPVMNDGETLYARAFLEGYADSDPMSPETYLADFNPEDVADLEAWWRADVEATVAEQIPGFTNPWYDFDDRSFGQSLGANGNINTIPARNKPKASMDFDGSNDRLQQNAGTFDYTLPKTIIVCASTPGSPAGFAAGAGRNSIHDLFGLFCDAGTWKARTVDGGVVNQSSGIAATANGTDVAAAVLTSVSSRHCRVNKVSDTADTNTNSPAGLEFFTVGAAIEAGSFAKFSNLKIHEVLVYNRALSNTEIDNLTDYLTGKYPRP